MMRALLLALLILALLPLSPAQAQGVNRPRLEDALDMAVPTRAIAADLFGHVGPLVLQRQEEAVPGWAVSGPAGAFGFIASTWELTRSVGYSGRPLDVLVAVDMAGRIAGARLMRHAEPILTLGLSDDDIARFVGGFAGVDLTDPEGAGQGPDMPDIISRATVSTGVIRDSILRTARTLAIARGLLPGDR